MNGIRALVACLRSVEHEQVTDFPGVGVVPEMTRPALAAARERPFNLDLLVEETIVAIEPHAHGYRIRCGSGAFVVIERGHTFDAAGLPVIEP